MKASVLRIIREAGFDLAGIAPATSLDGDYARYERWVSQGYGAGMEYLSRLGPLRADPANLLPGVRSVIVAAAAYTPVVPPGPLAAFAACPDYHALFRSRLEEAAAAIEALAPGMCRRVAVDSAPLLERALAERAGIGWIGRSTNIITSRFGPYVLLGEILTDLALEPDSPLPSRCEDCGRCVEACPTGALADSRGLDARRCLSYLTIEKRGPFSPEETEWITGSGRAFGCDLCLAACPHAAALIAGDERPEGLLSSLPALSTAGYGTLEDLCNSGFKKSFGKTPVARAGKKGMLRNLAASRPVPL
jgi:epoxyqueuosine reductase